MYKGTSVPVLQDGGKGRRRCPTVAPAARTWCVYAFARSLGAGQGRRHSAGHDGRRARSALSPSLSEDSDFSNIKGMLRELFWRLGPWHPGSALYAQSQRGDLSGPGSGSGLAAVRPWERFWTLLASVSSSVKWDNMPPPLREWLGREDKVTVAALLVSGNCYPFFLFQQMALLR